MEIKEHLLTDDEKSVDWRKYFEELIIWQYLVKVSIDRPYETFEGIYCITILMAELEAAWDYHH